MIKEILKGTLFVLVFIVFFVGLTTVISLVDFWILDKYFESESDYKICDANGCEYVSVIQESDCFENGVRINCSDIPIRSGFP